MNAKSTILMALGAIVALSGCGDEPPVTPVERHNTDHPDHGKVTFGVTWPDTTPDSFTALIGDTEASLSGTTAEFPDLLEEGGYDYVAFNEPSGLTFEGGVATVTDNAGFAASPNRLYADSGTISVEKDTHHIVPLDMEPLVRQLNISVEFQGTSPDGITIRGARLSGVARSLDLKTLEVSGTATAAPAFSLKEGVFTASHNLLGVVGTDQTLELDVTLPSGEEVTLSTKMDEPLAGFNSNRTRTLDVELTASNVSLAGVTLEIAGWQEGEIQGGSREDHELGTQINITWPGTDDKIEAVEITDSRGMVYNSPVENKKTVGLYELPDEIYGMNIFYDNGKHTVTLNVSSYDRETGQLTLTDEYNITKPFHFGLITDLAGTYYVRNDIDCAGTTVRQIGGYMNDTYNAPFTGTIDGGGFKLLNLKLATGNNCGLVALNEGTIKDLEIAALPSNGFLGDQRSVMVMGAFCAINRGTIENCINRAEIQGNMQIGGIVGINHGTIRGSANYAAQGVVPAMNNIRGILAMSQVGGIVGTNTQSGIIENCHNFGAVLVGNQKGGGIAGENFGVIRQVTNTGNLLCPGTTVGGIVGINDAGTISDATNNGGVSGSRDYTGGIAGQSTTRGNSITSCTNNGTVAGAKYSGGIAGSGVFVAMTGCKNTGAVSGGQPTGGIVGGVTASSNISYCDNHGTVAGKENWTGGIAGTNAASTIEACINHATGTVTSTAGYVGGIVGGGGMTGSTIQNCYNMASVTAGGNYVGGISGHNIGSITACKNSGNISHGALAVWSGGIAAFTGLWHTLTACYNTGDITGYSNMGGITGQQELMCVLSASYSIGTLQGENVIYPNLSRNGGVLGWNPTSGQVLESYWDNTELGVADNANTNAAQVTVRRFTYDAADPVWPTEADNGWKVADGTNGFAEGHYWSSLGDPETHEYPTLWWEPSGGELLIGVAAMPAN